MCIIVAKKIGADVPDFDILRNCFENNPDGAGFMYLNPKTKKVQIYKGFMEFEKLQEKLKAVYNELGNTKNIPFVYHFRIGTSGGNLAENTHPYPLGRNIDNYKKLDFACNIGVAHNGVISKYTPKGKNKRKMNDTQLYIYKKMYKYSFMSKYKTNKVKEMIKKETGSKFAILDTTGEIELVGDFNEKNNIFYSNYSYQKKTYNYNDLYDLGFYENYYYNKYNSRYFKNEIEMEDFLSVGNFIRANKYIYDYEYDEIMQPENNFSYIEIDGEIYYVDYIEMRLDFISDWYEIIDSEEELEKLFGQDLKEVY